MGRRGFTLIELLVVVSIIALLSSVVLASLNAARDRAKVTAISQFAAAAYHAAGDEAVGVWEFDECSGSVVSDLSGRGNNGSLTGGASWSTDTPTDKGCSVSMSATSNYVGVGNGTAFSDVASQLTVMGWIKVISPNCHNLVFSNDRDVTGGPYNGFSLGTYCGSQVTFRVWNEGSRTTLTGPTLQSGQWYHLAGVYDGSGMTLYIDGKKTTANSYTGGIGSPPTYSGVIGGLGHCPGACAHSLMVDSVRIFSKALVARDIDRIYAQGLSPELMASSD